MRFDSECIFCKIVVGEISSIPVYENSNTLAFMDINPVAFGHTLVIPKHHWQNLYEVPDDQLAHVSATAKRVATAISKALAPDGVSLVQANGKGAAQSVLHFHMHIIPRTLGDDLNINWKLNPGNPDEIRSAAKRIIRELH